MLVFDTASGGTAGSTSLDSYIIDPLRRTEIKLGTCDPRR